MTAICIMVLGTSSNAGKSWLATALCRYYSNLGLKVAPFKAQNMSNNARVVGSAVQNDAEQGGEIGSAQYFQALAARTVPDVRMNPLLLKPDTDTSSQVVMLGQVNQDLSELPWRERSEYVWPPIAEALDALRAQFDIVVIEGAGSPAEINLMDSDIVNLRVARHSDARCLLVTDIDRGGAFAHLYGTWALLPQADKARIHGFVLNKFRGDAALLAPAPQMLEDLTGIPTVATLPMWREHGLPEEDGMLADSQLSPTHQESDSTLDRLTIAVMAYPRISNLDEFQSLHNMPNVRLVWVRSAVQLAGLTSKDWVILPGSKNTLADLAWLKERGLAAAIQSHAASGAPVLGICGGLQMLGNTLKNCADVNVEAVSGLGLLAVDTVFEAKKTVRRTSARFGQLHSPWQSLSGTTVTGYEIHHGVTLPEADLAWQSHAGNVLGVYVHGMFEDAAVLTALWGAKAPRLDDVFEGLAQFADAHFEAGVLKQLIGELTHT